MKTFALPKSTKLCAQVAINRLFAPETGAKSALAFPLRAVWAENPGRQRGEKVQFVVMVPKKRLHHAVDRVAMRRRIREAYRLLRPSMVPSEAPSPVDIAFVFVASDLQPSAKVSQSVRRLLKKAFPTSMSEQK